jgi:outer membrane usher protein FimD/PapC
VNSDARTGPDRRALSGNYSMPLGPGTLLVNALQTLDPRRELAVAATYSVPLGPIRLISATASWRENASRGGLQYRRSRGASDLGLSYRLAAEVGHDPRLFDGSLRWDAPLASGQLDLAHTDGNTRARANITGSAAYVDGRAGLTRRLGRAFGVVALPGYPDIIVRPYVRW